MLQSQSCLVITTKNKIFADWHFIEKFANYWSKGISPAKSSVILRIDFTVCVEGIGLHKTSTKKGFFIFKKFISIFEEWRITEKYIRIVYPPHNGFNSKTSPE